MGDADEVRVVAAAGEVVQAGDRGGHCVLGAQDGVVEAQGEREDRLGDGNAGEADLGAQQRGAVFDVLGGAGVADERGDADGRAGHAQDEPGQELFGQLDFVGGLIGAHEGEGEGALGLAGGGFVGDAVFLGFSASGFIGGSCLGHVAVRPPDVSADAVVAAIPPESIGGGEAGGEVAGEAGQAAAGARREAATKRYLQGHSQGHRGEDRTPRP
ncbi:hypothetical protein ACFYRC_34435 [Streptomyces sp. NPDC005279]|uniref:hypothetical protein n=1 Tax=Streptomyces sp. NPDC005279 TaxID=3364712 RepID=UPI0036956277